MNLPTAVGAARGMESRWICEAVAKVRAPVPASVRGVTVAGCGAGRAKGAADTATRLAPKSA